jgi:hypothetical protein
MQRDLAGQYVLYFWVCLSFAIVAVVLIALQFDEPPSNQQGEDRLQVHIDLDFSLNAKINIVLQ